MNYDTLLNLCDNWLKYAIRLHLCREPKDSLAEVKNAALADSRIQNYLADIAHFHSVLVTNHKNPDLPIQKLLFLLDLGFDTTVPQINSAVEQILQHQDEHGIYQSMTNIPKHFGGMGEDVFGWCLCDAPLLLLALFKTGLDYRKYIKSGVDHLVSLCRTNGFPCAVSRELGKFRGPGKRGLLPLCNFDYGRFAFPYP